MFDTSPAYAPPTSYSSPQFTNQNTAQNSSQAAYNGAITPFAETGTPYNYYKDSLKNPIKSGREGKYNALGSQLGGQFGGGYKGGYGNIEGYNQDITSLQDIWKGKANSEDWGDVVGAAVGIVASVYTGGADGGSFMNYGRDAGRKGFPAIRKLF